MWRDVGAEMAAPREATAEELRLGSEGWALQEANARRLVACVNAFAGWPTEAIEALATANLANIADQQKQEPKP